MLGKDAMKFTFEPFNLLNLCAREFLTISDILLESHSGGFIGPRSWLCGRSAARSYKMIEGQYSTARVDLVMLVYGIQLSIRHSGHAWL